TYSKPGVLITDNGVTSFNISVDGSKPVNSVLFTTKFYMVILPDRGKFSNCIGNTSYGTIFNSPNGIVIDNAIIPNNTKGIKVLIRENAASVYRNVPHYQFTASNGSNEITSFGNEIEIEVSIVKTGPMPDYMNFSLGDFLCRAFSDDQKCFSYIKLSNNFILKTTNYTCNISAGANQNIILDTVSANKLTTNGKQSIGAKPFNISIYCPRSGIYPIKATAYGNPGSVPSEGVYKNIAPSAAPNVDVALECKNINNIYVPLVPDGEIHFDDRTIAGTTVIPCAASYFTNGVPDEGNVQTQTSLDFTYN
ncbi:fimbrial protein, partial [Enterobacter hormaechei]|uniref:fimbrial protein n=1 Tax=Enterobacter hormaechei TaxID=158836 RepID=UPI00148398A6